MTKSNAILIGALFIASLLLAFVFSMGFLDFKPGQGITAWLAFLCGGAASFLAFTRSDDNTIKYLAGIITPLPGIIALITFWSH